MTIKDLLPSNTWKKHSKGYKVNPCPYCNHNDCFDVTLDFQQFHCFSCRVSGNYKQLDKFLNPSQKKKEAIKKYQEFIYTDADGNPTQKAVKLFPKNFYQSYFDSAKKSWSKSKPKNHIQYPYNLPGILKSIKNKQPIAITEGEKDAETLISYGIQATTNACGAGKWDDSYSSFLKGAKEVWVFGDNDEPGEKHVAKVCQSLKKLEIPCKPIKLTNLTEKGEDISDWMENHTLNELQELTRFTKPFSNYALIKAEDLMKMEFEPLEYIIPNFLVRGTAMLIAGKGKLGKSWLALQIAIAKATGGRILQRFKAKPGKTLYVSYEDDNRFMQQRLELLQMQDVPFNDNLYFMYETQRLVPNEGIPEIEEYMKDHPDTELIIIDTLAECKPFYSKNVNIVDFDMSIGRTFRKMAQKYNVGIIIIHHTGKLSKTNAIDTMQGTAGLPASFDGSIILEIEKELPESTQIKLTCEGRRVPKSNWILEFDKTTQLFGLKSQVNEPAELSQTLQMVITLLQEHGELCIKDVADYTNKSQGTMRRYMGMYEQQGYLKSRKENKKKYYCLDTTNFAPVSDEYESIIGDEKPPTEQIEVKENFETTHDWGPFQPKLDYAQIDDETFIANILSRSPSPNQNSPP
jgi:5S rRNA maturation endonuclease (ribonuclease M5)